MLALCRGTLDAKAWSFHNNVWLTDSECEKLKLIAELLCIKHDYLKLDLLRG